MKDIYLYLTENQFSYLGKQAQEFNISVSAYVQKIINQYAFFTTLSIDEHQIFNNYINKGKKILHCKINEKLCQTNKDYHNAVMFFLDPNILKNNKYTSKLNLKLQSKNQKIKKMAKEQYDPDKDKNLIIKSTWRYNKIKESIKNGK